MKKKLFIIMSIIILVVFAVTGIAIIKPKYELNYAVKLIENEEYSKAHIYISNTENEENKKIVKEVISMIFLDNMTKGSNHKTLINEKATEIFTTATKNNIDYSSDDILNIYVKKLEDYIKIKNEISKEMIVEELHETYDLYFEGLEFMNTNFVDILNHIGEENFEDGLSQLVTNANIIAANMISFTDNYKLSEKANEIYEELPE